MIFKPKFFAHVLILVLSILSPVQSSAQGFFKSKNKNNSNAEAPKKGLFGRKKQKQNIIVAEPVPQPSPRTSLGAVSESNINRADPNYYYLKSREMAGFRPDGSISSGSLAHYWFIGGRMSLSKTIGSTIQEFSREYLSEAYRNTTHVYYPFGGPDVFYPHQFFPNLKVTVLVGLEPVGNTPDYNNAAFMGQSVGSLLSNSYFRTIDMGAEASNPGNATLSKVLASLAAQGAEVKTAKTFDLDSSGNPVNYRDIDSEATRFVVEYSLGDHQNRHVFYFKQDLSNSGLGTASGQNFVNFIGNMRGFTAFYKAASFLSLSSSFDSNSMLILERANYLVQSDTGIPYKYLLDHQQSWETQLFGNYKTPQSPFSSNEYQSDLDNAFAISKNTRANPFPENLPFRFCYNTYYTDSSGQRSWKSHIIYAKRR